MSFTEDKHVLTQKIADDVTGIEKNGFSDAAKIADDIFVRMGGSSEKVRTRAMELLRPRVAQARSYGPLNTSTEDYKRHNAMYGPDVLLKELSGRIADDIKCMAAGEMPLGLTETYKDFSVAELRELYEILTGKNLPDSAMKGEEA